MKYLSASFAKLLTVAACALTLGSCNRAEYAMLPKSSSYHGVARVAAPVRVERTTPASAVTASTAAPETAAAPAAVTTLPSVVAGEATAPIQTSPAAAVAQREVSAAETTPTHSAAALATTAPAPKLTRVQRFAASKLVHKVAKIANIPQVTKQLATAETQKISGNLRTGVILLLIGLLISLFSGINRIFGLIGGVIAVIGLIFIILYLLDSL